MRKGQQTLNRIAQLLALIGCLFWGQAALAASDAALLAQDLNTLHTLTAYFHQRTFANHRLLSQASGQMALSKPGNFRWETQVPFKQLIIADGHQVWIADIELEQVTLQSQQATLKGAPAFFLGNSPKQFTHDYDVRRVVKSSKLCYQLLSRHRRAAFQSLTLCFQANHTLSDIQWVDHLSQQTQVALHHVKQNSALSPSLFVYKIPRGFDVIHQ